METKSKSIKITSSTNDLWEPFWTESIKRRIIMKQSNVQDVMNDLCPFSPERYPEVVRFD